MEARRTGFEPATSRVTGGRSNQTELPPQQIKFILKIFKNQLKIKLKRSTYFARCSFTYDIGGRRRITSYWLSGEI